MSAGIGSLICPPKCISCGKLLEFRGFGEEAPALCGDCEGQWNSERLDTCGVCGLAISECACMPEELRKSKCAALRKCVYYLHGKRDAVQNRIIYGIKNHPSKRAMEFLASQLAKSMEALFSANGVQKERAVLVYLPRGYKAYAESGTDQGKQLALALSKETGIPVVPAIKRRMWRGKPQKKLNFRQRKANATATYRCRRGISLEGKTAFLVDDIVTTGATMAAGTRILRSMGAQAVYAVAIALDDVQKSVGMKQPTFRI